MPESWFEPKPFGKYVLTERIGAGGMAEIFRATAFGVEGFTKEVCIKRILPTLSSDETFIKMFIDEAKIAVTLHHANVVQVFDLGRIGEHYFIAMELIHGRDLLQIINACRSEKKRIPVPIALAILAEVCKGLDYAHRVKVEGRPLGLIHRDVSPSNILVSWEGEVKVGDFGIAKAASIKDEKTATGTMKGKYGYMSPEQVRGEHIDQRSDIFACGILMYESLVGNRLFKGETDLETLERVRAAKIDPIPSAVNKKVSPEVERIVLKALALNPADRYQTAGELHDVLADCLFAMGKRVDSKGLADFMHHLFAEEIRQEEESERNRAHPVPPPGVPMEGTPLLAPPTRPDLPPAVSVPPAPRTSPLVWVAWFAGILLIAAAGVILAVLLTSRPSPRPVDLPPPPPPVSPASRAGTLTLTSAPPGAAIELDNLPTGRTTPASLEGLDRSRVHSVRLTLPDHEIWSKSVHFGDVETVAVEALLLPVRKPPPPPPQPPPQPPKPAQATLNVNAVPVWAYVYVDGKKQDRPTPLYNLKLKPGTHTLRLENPKLGLTKTQTITLKKGQTLDLVVELK
jgi:serine/threonine protein kinase